MQDKIIIRGAREHNLKNINLELPRNKMIVFTGLSGSGKSSLAFDTIFAEGQRRYVESLSAYARQFLGQMDKPDVDDIQGLSPAISIDQKAHSANPRSTVATITEIYDYLRVLFARIGKPHCPHCKKEIRKMSVEEMVNVVIQETIKLHEKENIPLAPFIKGEQKKHEKTWAELSLRGATRGSDVAISSKSKTKNQGLQDTILVLSPLVRGRKGEYYQMLYDLYNEGFSEVRVDGKIKGLKDRIVLSRYQAHNIDLLIDRVTVAYPIEGNKALMGRLSESIELALERNEGLVNIILENGKELLMSSKFSCPDCHFSFPEIEPRLFSFNSPHGACSYCHGLGTDGSTWLTTGFLFSENPCPKCNGKRLRDEALSVFIAKKNIVDITWMSVKEAYEFFSNLDEEAKNIPLAPFNKGELEEKLRVNPHQYPRKSTSTTLTATDFEIAESVLKEIISRLKFMFDVGLDYLTLNRIAGTLSGGEAQRIRLASQIGSKLVGALYVLDEPTIGLHPRDNDKLLKTLHELRDIGNTLIVVEHDPETIWSADYLVDLGPGAGKHGGEIVAEGWMPDVLETKNPKLKNQKESLTVQYLRGDKKIAVPKQRRSVEKNNGHFKTGQLAVVGASQNNLKNIRAEIPLKRLVCVTGVSGSGKSTLVNDIIYKSLNNKFYKSDHAVGKHKTILGAEYLDKIIAIDQSAIGRTPRSNPATYTGAWGPIRDLFAATPEARKRGYESGRFSFNVPSVAEGGNGGRCSHCQGNGLLEIEMHFLPAVYVTCDVCKGKRFDRETLEVKYKDKNIAEVLAMTVEEAEKFFRNIPAIHGKLKVLNEVGLDYLTLGQAATTLSGGEAQRIKLSAELARRSTGQTLFILDEPTVGLHYADVERLLEVLQRLVSLGNTVLVIEHNLDVIKCVDWIIDLGPEGGDRGGEIVAVGTPEEIARKNCYTGEYLRKVLK
jgi:excinuclease ABC subunit A